MNGGSFGVTHASTTLVRPKSCGAPTIAVTRALASKGMMFTPERTSGLSAAASRLLKVAVARVAARDRARDSGGRRETGVRNVPHQEVLRAEAVEQGDVVAYPVRGRLEDGQCLRRIAGGHRVAHVVAAYLDHVERIRRNLPAGLLEERGDFQREAGVGAVDARPCRRDGEVHRVRIRRSERGEHAALRPELAGQLLDPRVTVRQMVTALRVTARRE